MSTETEQSVVHIDTDQLVQHWLDHSEKVEDFGRQLADARKAVSTKKAYLELVKSELRLAIRNNPSEFGYEGKLNNDDLEALITTQDEYKMAIKARIAAEHHKDLLEATFTALDHMRTALSKLTDQEFMEYHAQPRTPRGDNGEAYQDEKKRRVRSKGQ